MGNKNSKSYIGSIPSTATIPNKRPIGIKYKKNEIFLVINEQINLLLNSNGEIINGSLVGKFIMETKMTGEPEIKLCFTLPEKELDYIQFHQCVHTNDLNKEKKTILFNPPDGKIELLTYSMPIVNKPPILIESIINKKTNSIRYSIILHGNDYQNNYPIKDINIIIPIPNDSNLIKFNLDIGNIEFKPESNSVIWKIDELKKQNNSRLDFLMSIPIIKNEEVDNYEKRPIEIKFNIDFITNSGIKIKFIQSSEKSDINYCAIPWVKYCLQNGDYYSKTIYN